MKSVTTLLFFVLLSSASVFAQQAEGPLHHLTVLYTNDEHGWMEGMQANQSAANLYQLWQEQEGFTAEGPFLILSGGDNFTGPAISTWVQGESMVEVMNAMGYDAAAVGNHDFDFGIETLAQRTREAHFPYLSANTRWQDSGAVPEEIGILSYTIKEVNELKIGIIGLTTRSTPFVTNPTIVKDLIFTDYETALRQTMPALDDTDLQIVIAHVCMEELETLIRSVQDLGVDLAGGGHCNELVAKEIGDTVILGGGFHFTAYAKAGFVVNTTTQQPVSKAYGVSRNRGSAGHPDIENIVSKWADAASESLKEILAYTASTKERGDGLEQLIIDSWLEAYPEADIAITNMGGVRTNLPEGEITLSDMVAMMPFENTIISVDVTGQIIEEALERGGRPVVAGLEMRGQRWVLSQSGEPLQPDKAYTLLINSFMYAGGNNYANIAEANPDGFDTGVNYRQPFVDWLGKQQSTAGNPLGL